MEEKVLAYLNRREMTAPGLTVCVGFSGGADSVALLQLLWENRKRMGIRVKALHVNHGIRGAEALRDQRFCETFCGERKIPIRICEEDVPADAAAEGVGLEEAGRNARYRAFERCVEDGWADRIALAHHQNDQAETMLFHLMRGSGIKGLRGMEPVRLPYIRPLLCVGRDEIETWLRGKGLLWMEDASNQELEFTRNRIRHHVLAAMEEIRPGSAERMAETAERLLEIEDFLEQNLEQARTACVRQTGREIRILLEPFGKLHPALGKMLAVDCLEKLYGTRKDLSAVHAEQLSALASGRRGSRITLPDGRYAVLGYDAILLKEGYGTEKREEEVYCVPGGEYHYRGDVFRFTLENREKKEKIPVNCYTKWFDYDKIKQGAVLRTRRPGDYLEVADGAHKKLKDYLIDCKVPREDRDSLTLLADGSHIIWTVGMRISERYKVTEQTKRVLKVQWMNDGGTKDGETSY